MRRHKKGVIPYGWILVLVLVILAGLLTYRTMTGNPTQGMASFLVVALDAASNSLPTGTATLQGATGIIQGVEAKPKYLFMNIPPGSYTLTLQIPGYAPSSYTAPVTLPVDVETRMNVFFSSSSSTSPDNALVYLWSFNESALTGAEGEIAESIGKRKAGSESVFDLSSFGGVASIEEGIHGRSIQFDGVDDYSDSFQFVWNSGLPVTVTFWVRANSTELHNSAFFGSSSSDTHRFAAYLWGDKKLYWDYGDPSGSGRLELDFTPYFDKWVQVALISGGNGGTFKGIYVNGALVASDTISDGPDQALASFDIGRGFAQGAPQYYRGDLDEFRIYSRVLSASEISTASAAQRIQLVSSGGQGLVAHWKFDETSVPTTAGAIADTLGMSAGTAKGGVVNVNEGIGGKSFKFDGIDDEIQISNSGVLSPASKITLSGWFKAGNLNQGDLTTSWISKRDSYLFGPWKDGHVSFFMFLGGEWIEVKSAVGLVKEDVWQHWVATYDGSSASIYLNGSLVAGSQAISGALGTTGDVYLGHDAVAGVNRFFNGSIDNIQIYDLALSAAEVGTLSTAQKTELTIAPKPAIPISDCKILSQSGSYILTKDISASAPCLTFTASNIALDGNGYTLQQSSSADPSIKVIGLVANNVRNITVRNLRIARFVQGTQFLNVTGSSFINVSFVNQSGNGLFLNGSSQNMFTNCLFSSNTLNGVHLDNSSSNTFTDSTFTFNQNGIAFFRGSVQNFIVRGFFANNRVSAWVNDSSSSDNTITLRSLGGSTIPNAPFIVEPAQLRAGYPTTLAVGTTLSFKLNATDFHNLTVTSQTINTATFSLKSTPLSFTLSGGETKKVDLNGDKIFDVAITLVSVSTLSGANIKVLAIQEAMNVQDQQQQEEDEVAGAKFERDSGSNALQNITKAKSTESGLSMPIIIGILVGIIVLVVAIWAVWFYINDSRRAAEDAQFRPSPPTSHQQPAPFS